MITDLFRSQDFPKTNNFLFPDSHTYVRFSGAKKC